MAKYFITVGDSMSQAANTYSAVQTLPDGGTLSTVKIPPGASKISVIGAAVIVDGAQAVDTGNNFTLRFTGTGLTDGDQEVGIGALCSQETGTSVTGCLTTESATYTPCDIRVRAGELSLAAAFDGTDPGTPFVVVTLGFD